MRGCRVWSQKPSGARVVYTRLGLVLAPAEQYARLPFSGNSLRSLTIPDLPRFHSLIAGLQSLSQIDDRT